jgi:hypothetical protein
MAIGELVVYDHPSGDWRGVLTKAAFKDVVQASYRECFAVRCDVIISIHRGNEFVDPGFEFSRVNFENVIRVRRDTICDIQKATKSMIYKSAIGR